MATRSISETIRIRYLLGLSSPAEREHLEAAYFDDEDAFQEMLTAEDDLIDAYARGELTGEDRRRFEKRFVSSSGGRNRVQFARAFAGTVSATRPVETKRRSTLLDIFKTLQSPALLRTATIAMMIVFAAVLAWLVIDRRRMSYELRELRAESLMLRKRTETLQRSSDTERTPPTPMEAQPAELAAQPDKPEYRERVTTAPHRTPDLPEVKDGREQLEMITVEPEQPVINTNDATLGNNFESRRITQLPLNAGNVANLSSLPPVVTPTAGGRSDQAGLPLDGVDLNPPLNTYQLRPRNASSSNEIMFIPGFLSWIRFRIPLETVAIHDDYRITIKTADGRLVTSVNWIEPLTPAQTLIDTPAVFTSNLPSGDYVLLLEGKGPDGFFVEVVDYSFKVIKYQ